MNRATVEVSQDDHLVSSRDQETDPFDGLFTPGPGPHAEVALSTGTQLDFGRIKVTATVRLQCDQTQALIDKAGLLAFSKAIELAQDAVAHLMPEVAK